jgi:hypothetical protein
MYISPSEDAPIVPPFGDPNQALFNWTGNLSPNVADPGELVGCRADQVSRRAPIACVRRDDRR